MRIVQTFWSAGRNPLEYSFGWLRPEYNLMSWALSCLSLRKHYDEVALYTDEQGKHVLIDLLHLPYTEVNVVYDEHLCLPQHWSYAKVKTYSLQTKPFLHIDGDIFLFKPIAEDVVNAPLIAQSKEIGTEYYRQMMDRILQESPLILPKYIEEGLKEESIASYNMGVFGGNDMAFIHAYCEEALALCDKNKSTCLDGNFNLLFEQILFAYKAKKEKLPVSTIFSKVFNDNGYTVRDFCQLDDYAHKSYFHFLGGHKKNQDIIESLEEVLIVHYPDYYKTLLTVFPHLNPRGFTKRTLCVLMMTADKPVKSYMEFLNQAETDWSGLSLEDLFEVEQRRIKGKPLSYHKNELDPDLIICRNPYLKCFDVPTSWDADTIQIMKKRMSCKEDAPLEKIAIIPTLSSKRRKEYVLYELESQVLELAGDHPMQMSDLMDKLISKGQSEKMYSLWLMEIQILLNEGLFIPCYHNY